MLQKGHTIGSFEEPCRGYIINTCSVTAMADKKNRAVIRRCRREHPDAVLAVCGCHSQHDPEAIRSLGVDLVGGSAQRAEFIDRFLCLCEEREKLHSALCTAHCLDNAMKRRAFETLPPGGLEGRTRGMLKVQDGCVNFCTYCIIPYTRGPVRSQSLPICVEQAKSLADQGYREIVITGIEIASWGADQPGKPPLWELITAVCEAVPQTRIRLGSLEPRVITEEFCRRLKDLPNLCPHFHLSMQSGCDSVLKRMGRKYDTARYLESVQLLNAHFPGCGITTDMIVAFPGETEAEFRQSLAFIEKCGFSGMHIFPYSRRPGTPADKMPGQLSNAVKAERSRAASAVSERLSEAYKRSLIGTTLEVLFEEPEGPFFTGHAPNYIKVYVRGADLHNTLANVTITELYADGVLGELS